MKLIPLTQGYEAMVDDEDYEWLNQYNWSVTLGSKRKTAYAMRVIDQKAILMHVQILSYHDLYVEGLNCDHKDNNGLNNVKSNLRMATKSQNGANSTMKKNNKSGYRGVSWYGGKWQAEITVNGQKIYIGGYKDRHVAALMYNTYAKLYFGEFAYQNVLVFTDEELLDEDD